MLPSVSMCNCCSDHSLHEACLKLNYNAVKHVIEHKVIDINHVTVFSQTVKINDDDGSTKRGFLTKHFKHRYLLSLYFFFTCKPSFSQVTPAFCMLFENICYADSDIPEIDAHQVKEIIRIFKVSAHVHNGKQFFSFMFYYFVLLVALTKWLAVG